MKRNNERVWSYCSKQRPDSCAQNGTHVHKMEQFGAQNGTLFCNSLSGTKTSIIPAYDFSDEFTAIYQNKIGPLTPLPFKIFLSTCTCPTEIFITKMYTMKIPKHPKLSL